MPKETIRLVDRSAGTERESKAEVRWGRESGDCSLGVDIGRPFRFESDIRVGTDKVLARYRTPVAHPSADPDWLQDGLAAILDQSDRYASLWVQFRDRREINALIRALQKARDGAFGKDA